MTIEQAARAILLECEISPRVKGFRYLHSAIVKCYKDPNKIDLITKILYPEIAKEYGTSWRCVERCMRNAILTSKSGHKSNSVFIASAVWFLMQLDEPPT